jgi:hypothetical protein
VIGMNRFEKFKKLGDILGAEKLLEELVWALSESEAEELGDYIASNHDIFLEISEDNITSIVEEILSKEIYLFNEFLELATVEEFDEAICCDTVYEDGYISIEPLVDRELDETIGYLVWLKEDGEYKKRYYLKINEA